VDLVTHARVAEMTNTDQNLGLLEELKEEIKHLSSKLMAAPVVTNRSSTTPSPFQSARKVTFVPEQDQGYVVRSSGLYYPSKLCPTTNKVI